MVYPSLRSIVDRLNDATTPIPPKLPVPMLYPTQFDKKRLAQQGPATQAQPGMGSPK